MGERPRLELFTGLASLYHSRDFSDLVIFGKDGTRHSVHRAIVCPRSEYIYKAVKEGRWRDGVGGQLVLPEDDEVVRLMLEYFYLLDYDPIVRVPESTTPTSASRNSSDAMSIRTDAGTYGQVYGTSAVSAFGGPASPFSMPFRARTDSAALTMHAMPGGVPEFTAYNTGPLRTRKKNRGMVMNAPEPSPLATKEPHLILHARMYAAAEQYGIDGLKALSLDKFKIQLTRHWDAVELAEAIHVVYSSTAATDKDMREAVADTLGWHGSLLDKPEIEVAILEINGLAYELLKRSRRAEPEYMG
ncbi:putative BTB/POZ domain-containing protein [Septoria linicola]|nr:putative BTB/POZ domain-containing protein [Septoria linicola]